MVREAITSDILGVRALIQTVPGFWQQVVVRMTITTAIKPAHDLAFVWEDNSLIRGFVCAHDLGFRAYLSELVVDNGARHQGVATQLVSGGRRILAGRNGSFTEI